MRFARQIRAERFEWTQRKSALALSKPARKANQTAERWPLLAAVLPPPSAVDLQAEGLRRQNLVESGESTIRAFHARVWRESRRDYFAASGMQREAIRSSWLAWRGPVTALYFRYVVDLCTGVMQERSNAFKASSRELKRQAFDLYNAQARIDFDSIAL